MMLSRQRVGLRVLRSRCGRNHAHMKSGRSAGEMQKQCGNKQHHAEHFSDLLQTCPDAVPKRQMLLRKKIKAGNRLQDDRTTNIHKAGDNHAQPNRRGQAFEAVPLVVEG